MSDMNKLKTRVEKIEHKVDLAFEKIDDVREMAQEARTLSRHASQGHVELWSEVKSIQRTQENILSNQANFSKEISLIRTDFRREVEKLNDKITSNLKWSIRLFFAIIFSYISFIIYMLTKLGGQ